MQKELWENGPLAVSIEPTGKSEFSPIHSKKQDDGHSMSATVDEAAIENNQRVSCLWGF